MNEKNKKSPVGLVVILLLVLALCVGIVVTWRVKKMFFPNKVYFNEENCTICVGDVYSTCVKIEPDVKNKQLAYSSSDEKVATVSQNGVVMAIGEGEAEITVEHTFSEKKDKMKIVVEKPQLRIEISQENATLNEGETIGLNPKVVTSGFAVVNFKYETSDEKVATVDSEGLVTALDAGTAVITVYDEESGAKSQMALTVLAPLETLYFRANAVDIMVGENYQSQVAFTPSDASDQNVSYSISPEAVATVDQKGKVTGVSGGSVVLTVTHNATSKQSKMRINVYEEVDGIKLNQTKLIVKEGEYANVLATVSPTLAKDKTLTWTSSDKAVAVVTVSGAGTANIMGISQGTCRITATSNSNPNVTAEILVTVEKNESHEIEKETYIDGILVVNKTYGLPKDYNEGGGLTSQTMQAFVEMKKAAAAEGIDLRIVSGYRSYDYQKTLYNKYLNRPNQSKEYVETYSARPGYSEHQTGMAIDVNNASQSFLGTPEQKWLEENCVKYGFVIRYPEGKEEYTGFMYEPWHIRYLGKEMAQKLDESGLCLEEYLGITSEYAY